MMTRTDGFKTSAILILLSSLAFSSMAFEKPAHKGERGEKSAKMFRALDLTQTQKVEINKVREQSKEQMQALSDNKSNYREQMQEIITADDFDQQAFIDLQQSSAEHKQQVELIRAKSMHQIYHILDQEQQQKFKKMQLQRKKRN